jgi:hypothetical protein
MNLSDSRVSLYLTTKQPQAVPQADSSLLCYIGSQGKLFKTVRVSDVSRDKLDGGPV